MASMNESDGPVEIQINGEKIQVARLKIRDYLPWLTELGNDRKATNTKLIPAGIPAMERYKIQRNIALDEPSPDDLVPLLYTAPGQIRILEMALGKARDKDWAAKAIDDLTPAQAKRIAFEVCGLFTAEQLAEIFIANPDRANQQTAAAAQQQAATFGGGVGPLAPGAASPGAG